MSQHVIDALSPEQVVVLGFDRPLNDFFATVYTSDNGKPFTGDVIHWEPSAPTPEALAMAIAKYAVVPDSLIATLHKEKANRNTHPTMKRVDHRKAKSAE